MQIIKPSNTPAATGLLTDWLRGAAQGKTALLLSGGSAAHIAAAAWNQLDSVLQERIRISLADERYGPPGHADSNWQLLINCGLNLSDDQHVPVLRAGLDPSQTATAWEHDLRGLFGWADSVLAVFGIGTDFHIAGIKPKSPAADEQTALTCAYQWDDYTRITITPPVFPLIHAAAVYIQGAKKEPIIEDLHTDSSSHVHPDQLIKQTGAYTVYYQS